MITVIIILIVVAAAFLYAAFEKKPDWEGKSKKAFDVLTNQIYACTTMGELARLDKLTNDYYERYYKRIDLPTLNLRYKKMRDAIDFKKRWL